jgi:hypothetical protein
MRARECLSAGIGPSGHSGPLAPGEARFVAFWPERRVSPVVADPRDRAEQTVPADGVGCTERVVNSRGVRRAGRQRRWGRKPLDLSVPGPWLPCLTDGWRELPRSWPAAGGSDGDANRPDDSIPAGRVREQARTAAGTRSRPARPWAHPAGPPAAGASDPGLLARSRGRPADGSPAFTGDRPGDPPAGRPGREAKPVGRADGAESMAASGGPGNLAASLFATRVPVCDPNVISSIGRERGRSARLAPPGSLKDPMEPGMIARRR